MLKKKIDKEAHGKLDAAIQALYKQDGDNYVLQVEVDKPIEPASGAAARLKVAEDAAAAAKAEVDAAEAKRQQAEAELDVAKRTAKAGTQRADATDASLKIVQDKLKGVEDELKGERGRANSLAMGALIRKEVRAAGAADTAVDDILSRAERVGYKVNDNRDAIEPVEGKSVGDWIGTLKESAPHFFGKAQGANSPPGAGGGGDPDKQIKLDTGDLSNVANNIEKIAKGELTLVGA